MQKVWEIFVFYQPDNIFLCSIKEIVIFLHLFIFFPFLYWVGVEKERIGTQVEKKVFLPMIKVRCIMMHNTNEK